MTWYAKMLWNQSERETMTNFNIQMDDDGVPKPVVVENKILQDGSTIQATYDAKNYIQARMNTLDKMAKKLDKSGLDIERHITKFRIAHDEWCQARLKDIGQQEYDGETELLGGPCPTCEKRMANLRILLCEYLICYDCQIHKPWHGGSLCDDADKEQALRLLILNKTQKHLDSSS